MESSSKRMSFHNRLLLNRAAVRGVRTIEVMLATTMNHLAPTLALVQRLGGRVRYRDASVGYIRAEVPTRKLLELVADSNVQAYQISSFSKGAWYRDGPPQTNAEMFREYERVIPSVRQAPETNTDLPLLSAESAKQSGYTADEDTGVGEWLRKHPSFDGRGVTIAILESAMPELTHPTLAGAKTLDGREVPKLAGIVNAIDVDQQDHTRVELATEVQARTSWQRIGDRTYAMPRPGSYRFGLFRLPAAINLIHEFGVLQDEATHHIWVDTNGDADFRDETPVADVNEKFDVRTLKLTHPKPADLSFVVAQGRAANTVHIYTSRGGHQAMTLSVAAGSKTKGGLAHGVAPGARVLLVRDSSTTYVLHTVLESYLEAVRRPDVDLLATATGLFMVPDTAADFTGLLFRRMVAVHRKPIFNGVGNSRLLLNSAHALGDVFSVGGSIGPKTFAALFGGTSLHGLMIHPVGAAGPSIDGAPKPDFVAPVHLLSADIFSETTPVLLPKNAPTSRLPPGNQVSCCTSASGPYAGGVAALLLSAAKQQGVPYTVESLGRALRSSAQFLSGWGSHEQGSGVLDVNAAWKELKRRVDMPRIRVEADVVHALAPYAARGNVGEGLFEREGWHAGMSGKRTFRLTRESGPDKPATYRVSWTGNDGTFSTRRTISLPLRETASLPVTIYVRSAGVHSAILNLHHPRTDAIIFRTQAAIVASERFDPASHELHLAESVSLMRSKTHYMTIPENVGAMSVEFTVIRGSLNATLLPSHSLYPSYYFHLYPARGWAFVPGTYNAVVPHPAPGVWSLSVANTPVWNDPDITRVSTDTAEYAIRVRLQSASLRARPRGHSALAIDVQNLGVTLRDPVLQTSVGTMRSHHGTIPPTGLPNLHEIDVPKGSATLALRLRATDGTTGPLELYLYDCTSDECFSWNFTLPAARKQSLVVRRPRPGRWIAAVNAAPFPAAPGRFVLDEIITTDVRHHPRGLKTARAAGAKWTATVRRLSVKPSEVEGTSAIVLCELVDAAEERAAQAHPWEDRRRGRETFGMPVAAGSLIYHVN
ncbi:MAG: hypothetical protein ACRD2X_05865 [Vicinamibacteraceae bacterium]